MPILDGCCCFENLEKGSRASALFTAACGIINIGIDIWMLIWVHAMPDYLEENERYVFFPPGILVFLYIELACNIVVIGLSMMLWVGINYGHEGKNMLFGWVWGMSIFRVYQLFLLMYIMIWVGGHRISDVVFIWPQSIIIAFYWLLSCLILLAAVLCVVSYWQALVDEIFGKQKRKRKYAKISNLRAANRFPGTATPSHYGSKGTLAMSRQSLASRGYAPLNQGRDQPLPSQSSLASEYKDQPLPSQGSSSSGTFRDQPLPSQGSLSSQHRDQHQPSQGSLAYRDQPLASQSSVASGYRERPLQSQGSVASGYRDQPPPSQSSNGQGREYAQGGPSQGAPPMYAQPQRRDYPKPAPRSHHGSQGSLR